VSLRVIVIQMEAVGPSPRSYVPWNELARRGGGDGEGDLMESRFRDEL